MLYYGLDAEVGGTLLLSKCNIVREPIKEDTAKQVSTATIWYETEECHTGKHGL